MLRAVARCCGLWPPGAAAAADGMLWETELRPHAAGEFSMAAAQANVTMEDQAQVLASPSTTLVGVYDGHGGPDASRFLRSRLFPHVERFAMEQGGMSTEVIRRAFGAAEEEFHQQVRQVWPKRPRMAAVGSCCLLGAISGDTLYVANLGDSRAVLGRRVVGGGVAVAERLSSEHNAASEEVRRELAALNPDDAQIVLHTKGAWRVKGIIQVSRSIGDFYLKKPEYSMDPLFRQIGPPIALKRPALSAEPSVQVHKLKPNDMFLIFASDGLWEHLSDDAAVQIVFKNPRTGIANRLVKAALKEASRKREVRYRDLRTIDRGVRRHFHDDISVVVAYLDHHRGRRHTRVIDSSSNCTSVPVDIYSSNTHHSAEPLQSYKSSR
ncbi:probable protein phosphatase 2C 34 [Phragmites australis]|uniref:probable protein phosphatase 2C 34 n=1 Tax=Phragmites australis TaxID=29695 RepID=UPI002D78E726|nr:probable protein phosphatase 2C 34 [Phragmites australis]